MPGMLGQDPNAPPTVNQQFAANPQLLANLQQQGQGWLNQAGQMGQQAGGVAGNLANWNAQNPFQMQQNWALNNMAGGGFSQNQLQAFQQANNPNTGTGGGGAPPGGGGAWPVLPTQQPSQQVDIGMGAGADQRFNPAGGGIPPNIGAPMAPGGGGGGLPTYQGPGPGGSGGGAMGPGPGFAGGGQPQQPSGGGDRGPGYWGYGGNWVATDPNAPTQTREQWGQQEQQRMGLQQQYNQSGGTGLAPSGWQPPGGTGQPQAGGGAPGGQVGGGVSNPFGVGLNQAAGPGTTTGFTGTPTTAPTPQAPTQGAGGQYLGGMLGGGQQAAGQFGGFGADVGQARQAQLGGLLGQAQAPGMTEAQQGQMFSAQFDPAKQAIGESRNTALAGLSARGMGRSSAGVGNVETGAARALGSAAQQAGANVTGQNLALTQRQSEFGLGGLGGFAGQGMQGALGAGGLQNQMQGTANQMNLGMGGLGLGSEQLGTGNQLAMNQQNMQAQSQQFQQDNARAGLDLARFQTEQGFNMEQYQTELNAAVQGGRLDEQTAARMAQNALQTTQQGLQAQGMQNQANQALMNATLGMGGQALDYSGQNLQGQQAGGGMFGNLMGQYGGMGMNTQQLYQQMLNAEANRQAQTNMQQQGGGFGGFAGTVLGGGLGFFLGGPAGAAAGGQIGGQAGGQF